MNDKELLELAASEIGKQKGNSDPYPSGWSELKFPDEAMAFAYGAQIDADLLKRMQEIGAPPAFEGKISPAQGEGEEDGGAA